MGKFLEGIRSSVLKNFQIEEQQGLNQQPQETELSGRSDSITLQQLDMDLETENNNSSMYDQEDPSPERTNGMEDFSIDDDVYEEFDSARNQYEKIEWRDNRSSASECIAGCFWFGFTAFLLSSIGIGAVVFGVLLVNTNILHWCFYGENGRADVSRPINNLYYFNYKHLQLTVQVGEAWLLNFFHLVTMCLVFGKGVIDKSYILSFNLFAAFVDTVYRLQLQINDQTEWEWRQVPSIAIFFLIVVINSYLVSRHFTKCWKKRFVTVIRLSLQFLIGMLTHFILMNGLVLPVLIKSKLMLRVAITVIFILVAVVMRTIARMSVRGISKINHPGSSYVLLVVVYTLFSLLCRLQQAVMPLLVFTVLSFANSLVGFLEKVFHLVVDHCLVWSYVTAIQMEKKVKSFIGVFRTPRSQRLSADACICNTLHEFVFIFAANAYVELRDIPKNLNDSTKIKESAKQFGIRVLIAFLFEYLFTVFAVFIQVWYMNIPILKVWKVKWKRLFFNNLLMTFFLCLITSRYFVGVFDLNNGHAQQNATCSKQITGLFVST